jgi:hypothetical protein
LEKIASRSDPVLWFLLLVIGGGIFFYFAIYIVRPFFSVERYLMHVAPLATLAAARATSPHTSTSGQPQGLPSPGVNTRDSLLRGGESI